MNFSEWLMNEEKDACYHKVKARYDVWPSAYASGALVKCRKVGAKNWGNSKKKRHKKKKHMQEEGVQIDEALANKQQYDDAASALTALIYQDKDVVNMSGPEIIEALAKIRRQPPEGVNPITHDEAHKSVTTSMLRSPCREHIEDYIAQQRARDEAVARLVEAAEGAINHIKLCARVDSIEPKSVWGPLRTALANMKGTA